MSANTVYVERKDADIVLPFRDGQWACAIFGNSSTRQYMVIYSVTSRLTGLSLCRRGGRVRTPAAAARPRAEWRPPPSAGRPGNGGRPSGWTKPRSDVFSKLLDELMASRLEYFIKKVRLQPKVSSGNLIFVFSKYLLSFFYDITNSWLF